MTETTLKVKKDTVKIPANWKGARVFIRESKDTIVIKKIKPSLFWNTLEKTAKRGVKIYLKDIEAAKKSLFKEVNL